MPHCITIRNLLVMTFFSKNWIVHNAPQFVRVSGKDIMDQLVGNDMLDHELGCNILWRQNQVDLESNHALPYLNHRHILEFDFSVR